MNSIVPPIDERTKLAKLIWSLKGEVELYMQSGNTTSAEDLMEWFLDELGPNSPDPVVVQNQQYLKGCLERVCSLGFGQLEKFPRIVMRGKIEVELVDTPSSVGVTSRTCSSSSHHPPIVLNHSFTYISKTLGCNNT
jgi:hypothetical protein